MTTLQEIETHWSISDLAKAHQLLDVDDEATNHSNREIEREMKKAKKGR